MSATIVRYELGHVGAATLRRDPKGWLMQYQEHAIRMAEMQKALSIATGFVELFTECGAQTRIPNEFCKPTDGPNRDPDPERIAAHCRAILDRAGVPRWELAIRPDSSLT